CNISVLMAARLILPTSNRYLIPAILSTSPVTARFQLHPLIFNSTENLHFNSLVRQ
ncbi:hypothetical protein L9F63_003073, partial [Diploptera punctata]